MSVTRVDKDAAARTMTIVNELDAGVERVWRLWAEPRQLERWWGPPGAPATVVTHDLTPGGSVSLYVTSADGTRSWVAWRVHDVEALHRLAFDFDDPRIPTIAVRVEIGGLAEGGTRMTVETSFASDEAMDHLLSLGFDRGLASALGQIDAVLGGAS